MPGPWTLLHPETRLSTHDIAIVCEAARQTDARAPGVSR
jgi:hypothetical protein